jgi:hypothetical protein
MTTILAGSLTRQVSFSRFPCTGRRGDKAMDGGSGLEFAGFANLGRFLFAEKEAMAAYILRMWESSL